MTHALVAFEAKRPLEIVELDLDGPKAGIQLTLRMQAGHDRSYYSIATFMEDHLRRRAARLGSTRG